MSSNTTFVPMPDPYSEIRPHGIAFDAKGRRWFTLEGSDSIMQIDRDGKFRTLVDLECPATTSGQLRLAFAADRERPTLRDPAGIEVVLFDRRTYPIGSVKLFPLVERVRPGSGHVRDLPVPD